MKIRVFTDLRFTESATQTGVGKHITHMVCGLANMNGNDVSLLAARDQVSGGRLDSENTLSALRVRRLPITWKVAETFWTLSGGPAMDRYCKGVDWVYCPKNDFMPLRCTPLAVTVHGAHELDPNFPQSRRLRDGLNRARRRLAYHRMVSRADRVFTVSTFLKNQIIDWFACDEEKIEIVGNGVEQEYFDIAKQPLGISGQSQNRPYLLSVGGLNYLDGGDRLLQIARQLQKAQPNLRIIVAGGQHEAEYLRQAHATGNLEIAGYLPTGVLAPLMRDARALLFLTRYETFGIAAAEAMAAGTPVITYGGTAVPEIVGNAGFYLSDDPSAAVEMISQVVFEQSIVAPKIIIGLQRAKLFTWSACVGRLIKALQ